MGDRHRGRADAPVGHGKQVMGHACRDPHQGRVPRSADRSAHGGFMTTAAHERARAAKPLLGLRRQPGRLALAVMRMPRPLYHHGWGWLLDHTFLLIAHRGRKTGKRRETVAMALTYDPDTREAVVCSAGARTPTGSATSARSRRYRSRSDVRHTFRSSGSSPRTRVSPWRSSFDAAIRGGRASSRRFSGGAISAPRPRSGSSSARARSFRSGRRALPRHR